MIQFTMWIQEFSKGILPFRDKSKTRILLLTQEVVDEFLQIILMDSDVSLATKHSILLLNADAVRIQLYLTDFFTTAGKGQL